MGPSCKRLGVGYRESAGRLGVLAILLLVTAGCPPGTTSSTTTTTIAATSTTTTTTLAADAIPPSIPTGLTPSAASCSRINLAWNASTDAGGSGLRGYNVYRNGSFLRQVLAPATSTSDTGLAASTVYSYTVAAVDNAANSSAQSATASTSTPACPDTTPPAVPAGLGATSAGCSQVNLAWSASTDTGGSGLKGYNVYRNGSFVKQVLAPAVATSDAGLTASTAYAYAVAAVDNAGNASAQSAAANAVTPACSTGNLALVGFVPGVGTPYDVAVDGATGIAYVASKEFGLAVVDAGNPGAPVAIGAANPPFYGQRVAVDGTLAVVSGGSLGMKVVDLTTATAPRTVGALTGNVTTVAIAGQTAYALLVVPGNPSHVDLAVVSLAVPSSPSIVGRVTLGTSGSDIVLAGSLAYVASGTSGLQIVDVASPTAPVLVGTVDTPGTASGVTVGNGYAYVADGTTVRVVNVATPSQPAIVGSLTTSASAVALVGSRLYAVDGLQFKVIDVASPSAPSLLSSTNGYGAARLDVAGTVAFLASSNVGPSQGGLYLWNVAGAGTPAMLANLYDPFGSEGVAVAGTRAVAAGASLGMKVVDVAVPAAPRVLGTLPGVVEGVALAGQTAYALLVVPGNPSHTDLAIVSLAVPSSPSIAGRLTVGTSAWDVKLVGSLAYVAAGTNGLRIVSVASPSAPTLVGTADTPGTAAAVAVAGGYAYVADGTSVQVVNIATPSQPAAVGSLATAASALAVVGNRLYAIDGLQLKVIDVATPSAPVLLSATAGYAAQAIAASGTTVYLATPAPQGDPNAGVRVLDVANPTQPQLRQQLAVPGLTRALATGGGYLYAGDASSIVDVLSVGP